jgi:hypothetical protein
MRPAIVALAFFALSLSSPGSADETPHRHHGPHVHGEAHLNIGIDGQLLLVTLEAPGMSLLGYEHPPHDDPERAAYRKTVDALNAPASWLAGTDSAACELQSAEVAPHGFGADANDHSKNHDDDEHGDHDHADFDASYRYRCHAPLALHVLDVRLFALFPALHKINVDLVLPDRQGSQVLTPQSTSIALSK